MKRAVVLLVALAVLLGAPSGAATEDAPARDVPRMPDDVLAVANAWDAQDRAALDAHGNVSWRPKVEAQLASAAAFREEGRFRSAFNSHLSARVGMEYYALKDEVDALESPEQKRARILAYADVEASRAVDAFTAFRARLHTLDGNLTSLRAHETALYAASLGMDAVHAMDTYSAYRRELSRPEGAIENGLILGAVDTTRGAAITLGLAADLLDVAEAREGVRPAMNATAFANFTRSLKALPADPDPQPHMAPFIRLMEDARGKGEDLLLVAAWSASVRSEAAVSEQFKFQDAAGRGVGVLRDLRANVNATLALPVLDAWTTRGFDGLAARDAVDVAQATVVGPRQDVGSLVHAWIGMVHANFTARTFGAWSPIQPPAVDAAVAGEGGAGRGVPGAELGLVLAVAAAGAVALAGRPRRPSC